MSYLCTIAQLRAEAKTNTSDTDAALLPYILWASRRIEQSAELDFEPRLKTVPYRLRRSPNDWDTLWLPNYLLPDANFSVVKIDGTTLATTDYELQRPDERYPYTDLKLETSALPINDVLTITGLWGYRSYYESAAWSTAGALASDITASATSMTLAGLSAGALLKIGTEFCRATAVSGSTVTLQRGVNGTTAAAHLTGATVSVFVPEPTIQRAAARAAAFAWARRGAFEQATFDGVTAVSFPSDLPAEVSHIIHEIPILFSPLV